MNGGGPITGYGLGEGSSVQPWCPTAVGGLSCLMAPDVRAGGFVVLCETRYSAAKFSARWGAGFGVNAMLTAPGEALGAVLYAVARVYHGAEGPTAAHPSAAMADRHRLGRTIREVDPSGLGRVGPWSAWAIDDLYPLFDQLRREEWGGMAPGARSCLEGQGISAKDQDVVPCLDVMVPVLFDDLFAGEPGSRLTRMWHPDRVRRIVDLRRVAFPGVRIFAFPA